jgi:hypothetical protein
VLALLALACFPVLAQAGSGDIEYDPYLPGDGGAKQNENIAKTSESPPPSGGAEAPAGAGAGEGYSEEVAPSSEGGSPAGAGKDGGKGQGNPDKGNNPGAQTKVQPATPIDKSSPAASTSGDDDGGSSPLVPILIAVLALAAVSVAAVMVRQRRQRDGAGPSLSTKAG